MHDRFEQHDRAEISAVSGMGGVGKTELSLQYALSNQQNYLGGICWIEAREQNISNQIITFAESNLCLELPEKKEGHLEQVQWCWQNWPKGNTLVIFNDVTSYARIKPYLPPAGTGFHILLTTRLRLLKDSERLELKVLHPEDAFSLLELLVGKERVQAEADVAKQICQWLGYLPLGLELVSRYLIRKLDLTLTEMLARLNEKRLEQRALKKPEIESDMTAELGVAAAFELSWNELSSLAQEIGCLLSIFDVVPISWDLVVKCFCQIDPEELENSRDEQLLEFHLLQRESNKVYRLHELVREFFQSRLAEASSAGSLQKAITIKIADITKQDPSTTLKILNEKLLDWYWSNNFLDPSALEIGEFLLIAQQGWKNGIEPLSQLILEHRANGTFPTIGVSVYQRYDEELKQSFTYANIGKNFSESMSSSVVDCPLDGDILFHDSHESHEIVSKLFETGWKTFSSTLFHQQVSWPWHQTIQPSLDRLSEYLNERRLPVDAGYLSFEAAWHAAWCLTKGNYPRFPAYVTFSPISLDDIENKLSEVVYRRYSLMMQHCISQLKLEVEYARQQGETYLKLPEDFRAFKIGSATSPDILLNYTSYVFGSALMGYQQIVERWFPKFLSDFRLASYLPVRLIGTVVHPGLEAKVKVDYYWEPLPNGQSSYIEFQLSDQPSSQESSRRQTVFRQQEILRPGHKMNQQHKFYSQHPFDKFWLGNQPITELTYQWLWEDLTQLKWVKDKFKNAGYPYWR
ncbi:hypothetical protein IQ254_09600 [Nodosilinea sp. LEGE 07088]|nr:hypothetical protein [Nodosilinea sp. LEGE 07088]